MISIYVTNTCMFSKRYTMLYIVYIIIFEDTCIVCIRHRHITNCSDSPSVTIVCSQHLVLERTGLEALRTGLEVFTPWVSAIYFKTPRILDFALLRVESPRGACCVSSSSKRVVSNLKHLHGIVRLRDCQARPTIHCEILGPWSSRFYTVVRYAAEILWFKRLCYLFALPDSRHAVLIMFSSAPYCCLLLWSRWFTPAFCVNGKRQLAIATLTRMKKQLFHWLKNFACFSAC